MGCIKNYKRMDGFALLKTDSERFDCIFQNPKDVSKYGQYWPDFIACYGYDVKYMDYALKNGCKRRPFDIILYRVAKRRGNNNIIKRLIDAGYDYKPERSWNETESKLVSKIYCTVQFRRLSRRLAIITIGTHRCRSLYRQPGFADICKIIARSVWSARFAGSEWE